MDPVSTVLPRWCVICGSLVQGGVHWPLCEDCSKFIRKRYGYGQSQSRCTKCGKPIISEIGQCMRCRTGGYSFDAAWPLFRYAGELRTLVLAYKSRGRRSLAPWFAAMLAEVLLERYPGRVVVPIPPRPGKLRRKGWDQVEDIAGILERCFGVPVERVLRRADGMEQKALDLAHRAANVRGRIGVRNGFRIPVDPVLLDDVMTTGATLSECAAVLKSAGAVRVDALAVCAD
jgi:competence protein ComFC